MMYNKYHEEIQSAVNSIVAREAGFIQRAANFSHLLLSNPDFAQWEDGSVNEFQVISGVFDPDSQQTPVRQLIVKGTCYEFAWPLFDAFVASTAPTLCDAVVSEEDVRGYINVLRTMLFREDKKAPDSRYLKYEFQVTDGHASVFFQNGDIEMRVSALNWVA